MSDAKFQLQGIRDPRLAVHVTSSMPAWLWAIDGARILWANPVAAKIFGSDHSDKTFSAADPHRRQVMQLAARLSQSGATRMERLRGFGAPLGRPITCACARLSFADGCTAILIAAAEAVGRTLDFNERIENLLAGIAVPAVAFTLNGTLIGTNTPGTAIAARINDLNTPHLQVARANAIRNGVAELKLDFAPGSLNRTGTGSEAVLIALFDAVNLSNAKDTNTASVPAPIEQSTFENISVTTLPKPFPDAEAPAARTSHDTHWSVISTDSVTNAHASKDNTLASAQSPDSDAKVFVNEAIADAPMNVVPFRAINEPKAPALTTVESSAFEELARRLSAQLESAATQATTPSPPPTTIEETVSADTPPIENPPAFLRPEAPAPRVSSAQDSQLLDRLPVGVLIYRLDRLIYANRAFFESTGFSSLHELNDAGGLDALYVEPTSGTGESTSENGTKVTISAIKDTNGVQSETEPQDAKLFTISWDGEPAMALMFSGAHPEPSNLPPATLMQDSRLAEDLSTILDTTAEGIVIFDGLGRLLSCNRSAEALFDRSGDEIASLNLIELFAPESQRMVLDFLETTKNAAVASLLDHGRDMLGRLRDGSTVPLSMTIGRTRPDSPRFFAVVRNLSATKKNESEIRQAHRDVERATNARSDVLTRISHEVRMPLNAITGFADVMIEERFGPLGNDRYAEYMKDIRASGERVMAIINDLLDLSRIESGKMELAFVSQNLYSLVEQCVAVMQPQANRERKIIRTSLAHALPNVKADVRALRQIALNLIESSMHLANAGGQVIVSTANTDFGDIVLRVRDTGHGLNDNEIAAAMAPFRASAAMDHISSNTSTVSLSLTKALVEANRAQFHIKTAGHAGTLIEVVFSHASAIA